MFIYNIIYKAVHILYTTLDHTTPHHTTPHHTTPYHTTPYYTTPYHTTPHHTTPYHNLPYLKILYYTILYYTILYIIWVILFLILSTRRSTVNSLSQYFWSTSNHLLNFIYQLRFCLYLDFLVISMIT